MSRTGNSVADYPLNDPYIMCRDDDEPEPLVECWYCHGWVNELKQGMCSKCWNAED